MHTQRKNKIIAIIVTVAFHALLLLVLVLSCLHYQWPPKDAEPLRPEQEDEIMFGGEFVQLGNVAAPTQSEMAEAEPAEAEKTAPEPQPQGEELRNSGEAQDRPKEVVTSKEPSPMKVKAKEKTPEKPKGAVKSEPTAQDKQKAAEEAQKRKIASRMKFGSASGSGAGQAGQPDGNSASGAISGRPGVGGLGGYTLASWGRPSSPAEGTITITVKVNSRGNVVSASYAGGSGAAASNSAVRKSCIAAARQSSFSVPKNTTTDAVGTITWRFE